MVWRCRIDWQKVKRKTEKTVARRFAYPVRYYHSSFAVPAMSAFARARFHALADVDLSGFQPAQRHDVVLFLVFVGDGVVLQVLPAPQRAKPGRRDDLPVGAWL